MALKREAKFTEVFRHWLKAHPRPSAAFEIKQTKTNSLPFSAVREHQLEALLAVQDTGILYKLPDDSRGYKPFDMVYLRKDESFVVIKYPGFFVLIDARAFDAEVRYSPRKSLTAERARTISTVAVDLKANLR